MTVSRGSGVLLHISSLPSRYGIGDMGRGAFDFVDFLAGARQKFWQILPLGPTCPISSNSPYMSFSAFAGNPLFIDLEDIKKEGLLTEEDIVLAPDFNEYTVDFKQVTVFREYLLEKAHTAFEKQGVKPAEYVSFCNKKKWLDDYALFMSLKEKYQLKPWFEWPSEIACRKPKAIADERAELTHRIDYHRFVQYCFFRQWMKLKAYANDKGIQIIGDMPIYVAHDSVDVWANPGCFSLDPNTLKLTYVAGVPPDYFSETGQRWGNPLYQWQNRSGETNTSLYDWWAYRFQSILETVDICRIDHFRGFESYWQIDASEDTAINGRWVKGPGAGFFKAMSKQLEGLPIIAEDLGIITPEVIKLRDELGFPGMKILQFAFDSDDNNPYLPHNFLSDNCVVFTGTHDNDTTLGWFLSDKLSHLARNRVLKYANSNGENICRDMIRMAMSSVASISLFPMQDLLGFGSDCRMNTPGTIDGNWSWRCAPRFLNDDISGWLKNETEFYNRT